MHIKKGPVKQSEMVFYEAIPTPPSADPNAIAQPDAGGTPTPPATPPAVDGPDLSKLSGEQLNKVLENPELWKLPRIQELREQAAEAKKLRTEQQTAADKALEDNKKFEELAQQRGRQVETLTGQLKDMAINQALTNKLVPEGVVDVDGALKLIDRSKVSVDDNGAVSGIDEALAALKTDKSYLFKPGTPTTIGTPTNPGNGNGQPAGPAKFKRSQLTPEFYKAHTKEILEAQAAGLIEDDGPAIQ